MTCVILTVPSISILSNNWCMFLSYLRVTAGLSITIFWYFRLFFLKVVLLDFSNLFRFFIYWFFWNLFLFSQLKWHRDDMTSEANNQPCVSLKPLQIGPRGIPGFNSFKVEAQPVSRFKVEIWTSVEVYCWNIKYFFDVKNRCTLLMHGSQLIALEFAK